MTMKIKYLIQMKCSILLSNKKILHFFIEKKQNIQTIPASFSVFQFSSQTDKSNVHISVHSILILL